MPYYIVPDYFGSDYEEDKELIATQAEKNKGASSIEIHKIIEDFAIQMNFTLTKDRENELYDIFVAAQFENASYQQEESEVDNSLEEDKYLDMVDPKYSMGY